MTQPVQEPTQGRVNQRLEYRSRQLFRRPALSTVGVAYAKYAWTSQTIATGTGYAGQALEIKEFHTTDLSVFGTTDSEFPGGPPLVPTNTLDDQYIAFLVGGIYVVHCYMASTNPSTAWRDDSMPFFRFPVSSGFGLASTAQIYSQFAPGTSSHSNRDSPWGTYNAIGIGGSPADYLATAGSTMSTHPRISYSNVFELQEDFGPYTAWAGLTNESGNNITVTGYCEIAALLTPDYQASIEIFG
jgi:hypothetical protein